VFTLYLLVYFLVSDLIGLKVGSLKEHAQSKVAHLGSIVAIKLHKDSVRGDSVRKNKVNFRSYRYALKGGCVSGIPNSPLILMGVLEENI
jgi:hypothetical protein